jgi:glutamyl-tRNA synthetase
MTAPRLRFAPSPTGYLHIGGARTALFCWLMARRTGGTFILRVEDTDTERNTPEAVQAILDGLTWLGLDWDEGPGVGGNVGPYFQSKRLHIYEAHAQRLLDEGRAYRCYLTSEELAEARDLSIATGQPATAPRTWRDATPDQWPADAPYVIRVKAPLEGETVVDDLVRGRVVFPNRELSDPVIVRSNGAPLYNFACVVDDHLMHVSHVLRGDDHLSNTPKQIAVYDAFGWVIPQFAHLPLILGPDKKRLSKRHGATNVMGYDEMGYLPEALLNFLVRIGWSHGDQEIFTREELIRFFGLNHVGKAPGVWNAEKLDWINGQYINALTDEELAARIAPRIPAAGYPEQPVDARLAQRVGTLKERATTLVDVVQKGSFYWVDADDLVYDEKQRAKVLKASAAPLLQAMRLRLAALDAWTLEAIEEVVRAYADEHELGLGKVAQPLRVAAVGTNVSPGIFETLAALGREQGLRRLDRAITLCQAAAT